MPIIQASPVGSRDDNDDTNKSHARLAPSNNSIGAAQRTGMPTSDPELWPRISNVVGHFKMDCPLDLRLISHHLRNCEYHPRRFAAAIVRIREPKTTALIFANGKCVVTGAKSAAECKLAARKFARMVQKLGFESRCKAFAVVNVVANADIFESSKGNRRNRGRNKLSAAKKKEIIRFEGLVRDHWRFCSYEPETFTGLIYKMLVPVKMTMLIFTNGKIVFVGAKDLAQLDEAYKAIVPVLLKYKIS